jgi:sortase (surface protein transpeptidase)
MNRRPFQLILLTGVLVVLMIPVSIAHSQSPAASLDSHWTRAASTPISTPSHDVNPLPLASSMEYVFPDPPPVRDRDYCAPVSRLCEWLDRYGALAPEEEESSSDLVVPEAEQDQDMDDQEGDSAENRSVVGWSSASVSAMKQEQKPRPTRLEVPSLSISADVSGVGISEDRSMQVPDDYNTVGWYRHGPGPGDPGSAAIAGHLDDAQGRSVFYDLQYIEIGESVAVTLEDGSTLQFTVADKRSYSSTDLPADEVFARDGEPKLALITCGGDWDSSEGRYTETVVVYAVPA